MQKNTRFQRRNIGSFDVWHPALEYIEKQGVPIVIKADGLAAGKRSSSCRNKKQPQNGR